MITYHALHRFFERVVNPKLATPEFLEKNFRASCEYMQSIFDKSELIYEGKLQLEQTKNIKYYINNNIVFVASDRDAIITSYICETPEELIPVFLNSIKEFKNLIDYTQNTIVDLKGAIKSYKELANNGIVSKEIISPEILKKEEELKENELKLESLTLAHRIFTKSFIMGYPINENYREQVIGVYRHELSKLKMFDTLNSEHFKSLEDYIINKL